VPLTSDENRTTTRILDVVYFVSSV